MFMGGALLDVAKSGCEILDNLITLFRQIDNDYTLPLPSTYITADDLPAEFTWADVDGKSYVTKNLNQHIPQVG